MIHTPLPKACFTRRRLLQQTVAVWAMTLPALPLAADSPAVQAAIDAIIGDRDAESGELSLTTPAIAENGNTVPIAVAAGGRFTADDYVEAIHILAPGNPVPEVVSFHFTPRSGYARAATRIRLAETQDVIAIAELSDGRVWRTANEVKVTIGGCGG
ncbi:MAG: thiosulfate oxidation carrier protein SoxY [Gammaproteobacteria bacterium]